MVALLSSGSVSGSSRSVRRVPVLWFSAFGCRAWSARPGGLAVSRRGFGPRSSFLPARVAVALRGLGAAARPAVRRVAFRVPSWGCRYSGVVWVGPALRPVGPVRFRARRPVLRLPLLSRPLVSRRGVSWSVGRVRRFSSGASAWLPVRRVRRRPGRVVCSCCARPARRLRGGLCPPCAASARGFRGVACPSGFCSRCPSCGRFDCAFLFGGPACGPVWRPSSVASLAGRSAAGVSLLVAAVVLSLFGLLVVWSVRGFLVAVLVGFALLVGVSLLRWGSSR